MPPVCESEVRRAIGNGKRCCCNEIYGIGDRCDNCARHNDLFRVPTSAARKRQHAIARLDARDPLAHFLHDPS